MKLESIFELNSSNKYKENKNNREFITLYE